MNDGKEVCQAALKPAIDRVNAVKQYGSDKYNQGKEQVNYNLLNRQKANGMEQGKSPSSPDLWPFFFAHQIICFIKLFLIYRLCKKCK